MLMPELNDKQKRFADEYLIDLNATQAAIRAGYSKKTAGQIGHELLKKPEIQEHITSRNSARQKRTEISQDYVLTKIQDTVERCSQAEPVLDDEGNPTGEYKFDASNVLKGADLLGQHLRMWKTRVEVTGGNGGPIEHRDMTDVSDEELAEVIRQGRKT